jgi:hypothetical protein
VGLRKFFGLYYYYYYLFTRSFTPMDEAVAFPKLHAPSHFGLIMAGKSQCLNLSFGWPADPLTCSSAFLSQHPLGKGWFDSSYVGHMNMEGKLLDHLHTSKWLFASIQSNLSYPIPLGHAARLWVIREYGVQE